MKLVLKIAVLIFVAGAGFAGYNALKAPAKPEYEIFTVSKTSITQDVTLTGKTQSTEIVDLSFEIGGKVKSIDVEVGDKVSAGDLIMSLDTREQTLELAEAQASLDIEQSTLRELKKGTRPEEILIYEAKLSNAHVDQTSAQTTLADKVRDSFTKADDAIHNNVDQLFSSPRTSDPHIVISITNSQLKSDIEQGRIEIEKLLGTDAFFAVASSISPSDSTDIFLSDVDKSLSYLNTIKSFLDKVASAVNALSSNTNISQSTVDSYKAAVSSARISINTSISATLTAKDQFKAALSSVTLAEKELALRKAGATSEQISSEEAKIRQAQARIARLKVLLEKMVMRSPISGVVTKQDAKVGGVVAAQTILASVISDGSLEIEANIPEVDIGRVALLNPVVITVDAFPGETFQGTLSYIDPAETVIDGVVNFKSKIQFATKDARLKSGLTVNLEIQTARKDNVLVVPQLAILETDNGTFVRKLEGSSLKEVKVALGVRDQSGNVEVVSGLTEGDRVINVGLRN